MARPYPTGAERGQQARERYDGSNGLALYEGSWYEDENGNKVVTSLAQLRRMIAEAKTELDDAEAAMEQPPGGGSSIRNSTRMAQIGEPGVG